MSGAPDIAILGGGSFGAAIATLLARGGRSVRIWVRRADQADEINKRRTNQKYLPGVELPAGIGATTDMAEAVQGAALIMVGVPSRSFREVARALGEHVKPDQLLIHGTKGFEKGTLLRMSEILRQETCALRIGALSGPNLAMELVAGHPAGALIASRFDEVVGATQEVFRGLSLRVYGAADIVGTEVGGAFKNIIAIASGIADELGFGDNARSSLVTRGLGEMATLGVSLGADIMTSGGLAGIGDLMATCSSKLSRNHQFGEKLARGMTPEQILSTLGQVAEGVPTTEAVHRYAVAHRVDLPIVRSVHAILFEGSNVPQELSRLMALPLGRELAALRTR